MTERERLIDLLEEEKAFSRYMTDDERREDLADYLLSNGVIVLPCKVGDKVYLLNTVTGYRTPKTTILERYVDEFSIDCDNTVYAVLSGYSPCLKRCRAVVIEDFGNIVFLAKDEAEKALKERE